MLDSFQQISIFPMSLGDIIINIAVALLCGLFITAIYRYTYRGPGYSVSFLQSMVLLAMITSVVIMVIGNNLARAFGLVGAMSIIRFRTAVKETRDIVFIFFALSIGMAAGAGYHLIAFAGSIIIGLILYLFSLSQAGGRSKTEYLLQFSFAGNGSDKTPYIELLDRYCKPYRLINIRSIEEGSILEISYYVALRNENAGQELVERLGNIPGLRQVNLFYDNEEI